MAFAKPATSRLAGVLLVLSSAIAWGFSGTCGQYLAQQHGLDPTWISCARMGIGAVVLVAIGLATRREQMVGLCRDRSSWGNVLLYAVFGVILCQVTYLETIAVTSSGTGTMLEQIGVLIVMAVTCVKEHRLPRPLELAALAAAVIGVFCIATKGDISALHIPPEGLAWGAAAAVAFALYMLLPVPLLERWGSIEVTAVSMAVAAVVGMVVFRPWEAGVELPLEAMAILLAMVATGTVYAYLAFLQGVKLAGPLVASLLNSAESVSAFVISALWLGTAVTAPDVVGLVLIVGMVVLVALGKR